MADMPLPVQTISDLARQMQAGSLSPVDLTQQCLARLDALDGTLNAFRLVDRERALAAAQAAELVLRAGQDVGPLHGIPYAVKDLFDVKGWPTTAGSNLLRGEIATEDSAVTARLARAGMVLLGKTNTVQFAYGGVGINHDHGTPHNPWQETHYVPGGSSSGSGVAVAAGIVPMALGSDTGGSVRIPASLCGTVGLKTTVGQVSRAGVFPLSWSLDSVGPLTRSVEDAALVYDALQGVDARDPSTRDAQPRDVLTGLRDGVRGLRLAFAETVFWDDADAEVVQAVRQSGEVLAGLGAQVESVEFPEAAEALALNPGGLVIAAEAYTIHQERLEAHFDAYDPIIGSRMIQGKEISAVQYLNTTRAWDRLRQRVQHSLRTVDALLAPATMIPARPVAEVDASIESYVDCNLKYLRNTSIGNILGLCGLSVPCGFTREGLPIGLMIYGKPFHEDMILRIGYAFEQAAEWRNRTPNLAWISSA
ncbi:MAG: amidase [Candidatus Tectomicrobia bacterium]|nr:amidase [Candidatus Tectomicrobia bacterium]